MRRTTIGIMALGAITVSGCGGGSHFSNQPRPAAPVDLTVYINNARVSVSPGNVGAGPVIFIITNQSDKAQSLTILPAGASASQPLADTGPINPQATSQVTVNFKDQGNYTITNSPNGS